MTIYSKLIKEILEKKGFGCMEFDPRHIEAFIRMQYGTPDHLSRAAFENEVSVGIGCIMEGGVEFAEQMAVSQGL